MVMVACQSKLEPQRVLIEDLDRRLGTAPSLDSIGALRTPQKLAVPETDNEARFARIVEMVKIGEPTKIDLPTVRQRLLANNLGLQASLLGPEVATEQLRAEQAKFEATFALSAVRERNVSPQYYGDTAGDVRVDQWTIVPSLNVPLQTGGSINLDWTLGTSDYQGDGATGNGSQKFSVAQPTIGLKQPLLRNAGFEYNEASIVLASANVGAQRSATQFAVINQLLSAEAGYWNLYLAWRTLKINTDLYDTAKKLLQEQRELVKHQTGSIANVYNFEVTLARAVDNVLISERGLHLAVRKLKTLMQEPGLSLHSSLVLVPSTQPKMIAYEFNPSRLVAFALENRADLLQLEYQRIQYTIKVMTTGNQTLPEVDVQGKWTFNGFDASGLSLGAASRDLFDGNEPGGWMASVNVSVPIGNKVARSNYRAALLKRLKAIADVRNREITVTSEVLDAIDDAETRWQQVITTRYERNAAYRFFDAYTTLFNRGQIPSINLAQALQAKGSAEIQTVTSEVQYQLSLARLAQSAGCLMGHSGVDWGNYLDKKRLEDVSPSTSTRLPDRFEPAVHKFSAKAGTHENSDEDTKATPTGTSALKKVPSSVGPP